jgi:isocitrate lyase
MIQFFIFVAPAVKAEVEASGLENREELYELYLNKAYGKSHTEAREIAAELLGKSVFWDCDGQANDFYFPT